MSTLRPLCSFGYSQLVCCRHSLRKSSLSLCSRFQPEKSSFAQTISYFGGQIQIVSYLSSSSSSGPEVPAALKAKNSRELTQWYVKHERLLLFDEPLRVKPFFRQSPILKLLLMLPKYWRQVISEDCDIEHVDAELFRNYTLPVLRDAEGFCAGVEKAIPMVMQQLHQGMYPALWGKVTNQMLALLEARIKTLSYFHRERLNVRYTDLQHWFIVDLKLQVDNGELVKKVMVFADFGQTLTNFRFVLPLVARSAQEPQYVIDYINVFERHPLMSIADTEN